MRISNAYLVSNANYSVILLNQAFKIINPHKVWSRTYCSNGQNVGDYFVVVMRMEPENNIKMIVEGFPRARVARNFI